jgi:hypothetical protein
MGEILRRPFLPLPCNVWRLQLNNQALNSSSFKESGWVKPILEKEEDLSIEELYGFPESELSVERVAAIEISNTWPQFFNPLDADASSILPKYFKDNLGSAIFAPGLIHWLYGPSETGKSFIALTACLESAGIYFSLEMGPNQMGNRVRKMGYHYLDSSLFLFPESPDIAKSLLVGLKTISPTIIIIDSFAELALLCGADTNNDQDVGGIFRDFLKPMANAGHSIVVVDHIAKNPANTDYPLGTQNKKSQSDVLLFIDRSSESGMLELKVTKDRYSIYDGRFESPDRKYGIVELTDLPTRAKVHRTGHEEFMPISHSTSGDRKMQDSIIKALNEFGALQKSHIKFKVTGSEKRIDKALIQLAEGGWISITKGKTEDGYPCRIVSIGDKPWVFAPRLIR